MKQCSGFIVACCTEVMAESVQCLPRPVRFPMAAVMTLSAGSVTQSCVILPYCIMSIVALFVHLSGVHCCLTEA